MPIQRVRSKWAKTQALLADPGVRRFIPETRPFTRATVNEMLERLGMIYVKPVNGTFGQGVIRVGFQSGNKLPYVFQTGVRKYRYASFAEMFRGLAAVRHPRPYLVQQGIPLLKYRGRRFDLRLTVQKNLQSQWEATGLIGRLAHPRKIVTNYHNGGTPMTAEKLFSRHLPDSRFAEFRSGLNRLGTLAAQALERKFPRLKEIGIDIAVDNRLRPWILEVNTLPDLHLFRKLPDPSVFRRMYRYAAAYGRFRRTKRRNS